MRRVFCIVLCLLMLSSYATAAKDESLEGQLNNFMYENGLNEENFALSYFNVSNGSFYNFNENAFFNAGELWVLPLHMYYCSEEYHGAFLPAENDPDYKNPDYEYKINGMTLDTCRTESILKRNKTVNEAMRNEVMRYYDEINEKFGHIDPDILPQSYYTDNCYSTQFLMNCMKELETRPEIYADLIRLYNMLPQSDGFKSDEEPLTNKTTFQIRGEENDIICAVAEVNTTKPYLLVCFVSREAGGDQILAKINALICSYIESASNNGAQTDSSVEGINRPDGSFQVNTNDNVGNSGTHALGVNRTDASFQIVENNPNQFGGIVKWLLIAFGGAIALAVLLYAIDQFIKYLKKRHHKNH